MVATSPHPSSARKPSESNPEVAFNFFVSKGLTEFQSAGVAGNLEVESGLDPARLQIGSSYCDGEGVGVAQWSCPGRWNELESVEQCSAQGCMNLTTELNFVWWERTTAIERR